MRILVLFFLTWYLASPGLHAQSTQAEWKKGRDQPSHKPVPKEQEAAKSALPKWTFGINGGYGYRLFRAGNVTTAANEKYIKSLKSGIVYGGHLSYYPWTRFGFGLRYEKYQSQAETEGEISEDVNIQHLSGLFTYRSMLKNHKTAVLTSLLLGYQPYQNKTKVGEEQLDFSGNTMGWGVSVGLEHRLGEKFSLNLTGTAMMGAIYKLKRKTDLNTATLHLSKDDSVDLSRFSVTLGFGFLK
ncbi:outer membrane beta-barrel protein [Dyadobacter sp. CY323]|uniref:outer membrane beta-barrel protein n=1 Tax=Dyadobacter sp. CY323 TaxID=2907302 RepID=UPI001F3D7A3D|nr:outer membrane beta-barrel protein [Dyadobacter sp. CY323]